MVPGSPSLETGRIGEFRPPLRSHKVAFPHGFAAHSQPSTCALISGTTALKLLGERFHWLFGAAKRINGIRDASAM